MHVGTVINTFIPLYALFGISYASTYTLHILVQPLQLLSINVLSPHCFSCMEPTSYWSYPNLSNLLYRLCMCLFTRAKNQTDFMSGYLKKASSERTAGQELTVWAVLAQRPLIHQKHTPATTMSIWQLLHCLSREMVFHHVNMYMAHAALRLVYQ